MTAIAQQILRGCFFNLFSLCIAVQAVASCSTLCKAVLIDAVISCNIITATKTAQYAMAPSACLVCCHFRNSVAASHVLMKNTNWTAVACVVQ